MKNTFSFISKILVLIILVILLSTETALASSNNLDLFPDGSITIEPAVDASGVERTITLVPAPNQYGTALITVSIDDSKLAIAQQFTASVLPLNDAPIINEIPIMFIAYP